MACSSTPTTTTTPIANTVEPDADQPPRIDTSKLDDERRELFEKLVNSLKSPCGRAHSLRTSYTSDRGCERAPYAARYVIALLEDEVTEDRIVLEYARKYEPEAPVDLDVSRAPYLGTPNAPIRLVEFLDYGCAHCADLKPVLDKVIADHPGQVVVYLKMFPLKHWPHSQSAAQAMLAAHAQQKGREMHALLFEKAPAHAEADVTAYAGQLGLDLATFAVDYKAAAPQVDADHAQGEALGIDGVPMVFFNGRKYSGPLNPRYFGLWIAEELAVN